jgi:hypothetical protein
MSDMTVLKEKYTQNSKYFFKWTLILILKQKITRLNIDENFTKVQNILAYNESF